MPPGFGVWVGKVGFLGLFFNILKLYCRDIMGWLSVEKEALQDGKWPFILERNWGNGMSLVNPQLENKSPVAAGCPQAFE